MKWVKNARVMLAIIVVAALTAEPIYGQSDEGPAWSFTRLLRVGDALFQVAVADSVEKRMQGLSGVPAMGANEGLYFMYSTPQPLAFWMKDMRFPIDIVWIDQNQRVIHIMENLTPQTYPRVFGPRRPAQYVLEINAGRARETGIAVGDSVRLQ